ncbi:MAG: Crp/Fnr family transcriptional regulator, partial [Acidobacteria bacterium]|nr:Crp/Fnr family transcriptional regulator [Acidobacteriota bacterium]
VRLVAGSTLFDIGSTSDHAWFITSGIVSLLTTTEDGDIIEAAAVGREGVVGLSGITKRNGMTFWAQVQISGEALQISAKTLQNMLGQERDVYESLFEYAHTLSEQIGQTVVCNWFHKTEQRLARWLLMAQDRVSSDSIVLTHDNMAQMLGVSRSRVSLAAGILQRKRLIHYSRGHICILNRRRLEKAACECYQTISQTIGCFLAPKVWSVSD